MTVGPDKERVLVTLDKKVLAKVDDLAGRMRMSRAGFISTLVELSIDEHVVLIKIVEPVARVYEKIMGVKQAKAKGV
jgi:metal-responsive CopG/Arc/MetJ family transcriptional regulator